MAYTLQFTTSAPPTRVLDAISGLNREWREPSIPAELRRRGAHWLRAKTGEERFTLAYGSNWEAYPPVVIEGVVRQTTSGSSTVTATVGYGRFRQIGAAVFGALGVWVILSGHLGGTVLLGMAGLVAAIHEWQHLAVTPAADPEAAYLVERLERTVANAGAAG